MHDSVMRWVGEQIELNGWYRSSLDPPLRVLEIGSRNVNGTVRHLFGPGAKYIGVDIEAGPGVDRVASSHDLPFAASSFEVVVCTEMLEHDTRPWRTMAEIARVAEKRGRVVVTCRGYTRHQGCFPVHDFPGDYWRYTVNGLAFLMNDHGLFPVVATDDPDEPGVFIHAVRV